MARCKTLGHSVNVPCTFIVKQYETAKLPNRKLHNRAVLELT